MTYDAAHLDGRSPTHHAVADAHAAVQSLPFDLSELEASVDDQFDVLSDLRAKVGEIRATETSALDAPPTQREAADALVRARFTEATKLAGELIEGLKGDLETLTELEEKLAKHETRLGESVENLDRLEQPPGQRTEGTAVLRDRLEFLRTTVGDSRASLQRAIETVGKEESGAVGTAAALERAEYAVSKKREHSGAVEKTGNTLNEQLQSLRGELYTCQDIVYDRWQATNAVAEVDVDAALATAADPTRTNAVAAGPVPAVDPALAETARVAANPTAREGQQPRGLADERQPGEAVEIHQKYAYSPGNGGITKDH
ncbi:hypothetical protein AB0E69_38660 [Kribbella sp. NPDC026611]|uniref:hypothetical protein n=1 Tax=Kribbella sp. NPDC026611 TaxID=3154911 RepID=UPI0033CB846D